MDFRARVSSFLGCVCASTALCVSAAEPPPQPSATDAAPPLSLPAQAPEAKIWEEGVGEGFRAGTQTIGLTAGASYGLLIFGSEERHHLALGNISYGRMLGDVKGKDHWYRGNWEVRGELSGGAQFHPRTRAVFGLTAHIRYHFATGKRWVPFVDAGAGMAATDIGEPDLGGWFQFRLSGGAGINWFIKDNLAISFEGRYMHFSSKTVFGDINEPNLGLNTAVGLLGVNWFF